jgi:large subunit ribosomal protein L18
MDAQKHKAQQAERRRFRVRKNIYGTPEKPRLSVHRTNLHIYAQLIDDLNGVTIASAASNAKGTALKHGANLAAATAVGKDIAAKAKAKGITVAAFDRGQFRFHGRILALAKAATEGGLVCTDLESLKAKLAAKPEAAPAEAPAKKDKAKGDAKAKGEGKPKGDAKKDAKK